MTSDLQEFLKHQIAELEQKEADLAAKVSSIAAQLQSVRKELNEARCAMGSIDKSQAEIKKRRSKNSPMQHNSIQSQALEVLRVHPSGLTAAEIEDSIERMFGRPIKRESLAPQLSRLRQAGHISHIGNVYVLPKNKEEQT